MPALLLIEDDPLSRDLIRALCESRGFTVDAAPDGFTGLRMLRDGAYALALVDYHLPEMDGYALARLMRDLGRQSGAPLGLVAITADRFGLAARRGSDGLFDAVLPKPLDPATLFATLDRLGGGDRAVRGAAEALVRAPDLDRARAFAEGFWRRHGLAGRPRAWVRPAPDTATRAALAHVFDVVDEPAAAELVLLLDPREIGPHGATLPVIDASERGAPGCEAAFRVADPASWGAVADALRRFAAGRDAQVPAEAAPAAAPSPTAPNPAAQVLVIERSDAVRETVCEVLTRAGHGAHPAKTLIAAVAAMDAQAIDLVLLGSAVPGLDVVATATLFGVLRGRHVDAPAEAEAPVLALMSSGAPIPLEGAGLAGIVGLDSRELLAAVTRWRRSSVPILDATILAQVQTVVGRQQAERMVEQLFVGLDAGFAADRDASDLASHAHVAVSTAGMLGFTRLSDAARALEAGLKAGRPSSVDLADMQKARQEACRAFDQLRTRA